jgi:hypothetical protein
VRNGYTEEQATAKVDILIDSIHKDTTIMLNAVESYKSIKMDPEERAFYEGDHLISELGSEEDDLFKPPKTDVSRLLKKVEDKRKEEEQERKDAEALLNGVDPDAGSVEEGGDNGSTEGRNFDEGPIHPY